MDSILAFFLYKALCLVVGGLGILLGYKLFTKGVFPDTDLGAGYKSGYVTVVRAAPGTAFALFGAAIIVFTVSKGFQLNPEAVSWEPIADSSVQVSSAVDPDKHKKILEALSNGKQLSTEELIGIKIYFHVLETNIAGFGPRKPHITGERQGLESLSAANE